MSMTKEKAIEILNKAKEDQRFFRHMIFSEGYTEYVPHLLEVQKTIELVGQILDLLARKEELGG